MTKFHEGQNDYPIGLRMDRRGYKRDLEDPTVIRAQHPRETIFSAGYTTRYTQVETNEAGDLKFPTPDEAERAVIELTAAAITFENMLSECSKKIAGQS